jgi:hypothetical protein
MNTVSIEVAAAKPPFVSFETRAVEDRVKSLEAGVYMTKDVDFVKVTPPGSKDCIEMQVDEWFTNRRNDVSQGRFPGDWLRAYEHAYSEWKKGNELPTSGTPIKTWPAASPSQVQTCLQWHVRTVEELAEANEEVLLRLGMGGRALKQQAVNWLASSKDIGGIAGQLTSMQSKLDSLAATNATLLKQNEELRAQLPKQDSPADRVASREESLGLPL